MKKLALKAFNEIGKKQEAALNKRIMILTANMFMSPGLQWLRRVLKRKCPSLSWALTFGGFPDVAGWEATWLRLILDRLLAVAVNLCGLTLALVAMTGYNKA